MPMSPEPPRATVPVTLLWTLWCASLGVFGAVLLGGGLPATDGAARTVLALLSPAPLAPFDSTLRFSLAVLGAVSFGWSVTLWRLGAVVPTLPPAAAAAVRSAITAGIVTWFVTDSTLSVLTGFGRNVVPNVVLLASYFLIRSTALRARN